MDLAYLSLALPLAAANDQTHNVMGAAMLNKKRIAALEIPFPELEVQRRIAANLKAQLAAVEAARKAAQAQYADSRALMSRLRADASTELESIGRVRLGEVLRNIETGKSFHTTDRLAREDELGVLKVSAVSWMRFDPSEAKAVAPGYAPEAHHRVRAGDLLMSRANTVELVGAVVRARRDFPNRLLSDKTLRLVVDETKAEPDYLLRVLRLREARDHIEGNATGTSSSMRNISQNTIRATPIPLPSLPVQRSIAQRLDRASRTVEELRVAVESQLADLEALPARLLAAAFERPAD